MKSLKLTHGGGGQAFSGNRKQSVKRALLYILLPLICAVLCIGTVFSFSKTTTAYAYNDLTDIETIGSLYKSNGKFSTTRLDALASKLQKDNGVNYSGMSELIADMRSDDEYSRTSADFGEVVVDLGWFTFGENDPQALTWIPAYVSNSDQGPILTLWLAYAEKSNGTVSNQEVSTWSDGTYSSKYTSVWTDNAGDEYDVYSNTYSSSYLRNYVLNGNTNYATGFGSGKVITSPGLDTMTKFTQFTEGDLARYIVAPKDVEWQRTENNMENDPLWDGGGNGGRFPSDWTNDKLWLPGLYELYDIDTPAHLTNAKYSFTDDGGLWEMDGASIRTKREALAFTWTRTGVPDKYQTASRLGWLGGSGDYYVNYSYIVRPALHLNLSMALANSEPDHEHVWQSAENDGWVVTTPATCMQEGEEQRVCIAACCPLTDSKETRAIDIDPNAHDYDTEYTIDSAATCTAVGSKSKHCKNEGCTSQIEITEIPVLGHAWGEWQTVSNASCNSPGSERRTCTRNCGVEAQTREIPASGHSYNDVVTPPTCETGGKTTHTCANCGDSYDDNQTAATGHTWSEPVWQWAANYATCRVKFTCSTCNKEQTEMASVTHNSEDATCTVAGNTTHTASVTFNNTDYSDEKVISGQTLPHSGELVSTTVPPTCTEDGVGEYQCATCDRTYTDIIPSYNGHELVPHEAQAPNCTEAGWDAYDTCSRCDYTTKTEIPALDHNWASVWSNDETNHWHACTRGCDEINDEAAHTHEWVITTPATTEADGLMENLCTECGHKDGEEVIAKLDDGNGNEIDLPVDIDVEFNVTQSNTGNYYSDIDKGLKRGYWAQLWYRNGDGTLGDEFTDKINCFLTLKIPDEIVKGILDGEPISRDKIAEGLSVYYINEEGTPVEVENFTIVLREDNSCQIKFNYNEKFRAEIVFAADVEEDEESGSGIPWWVWLIVGLVAVAIVGVVIIIIVVIKKKNGGDGGMTVVQGTQYDDAELKAKLSAQDRKLDEIKEIVDGGFNDVVDGE